ncbi:hypothetical protein TNCV_2731931 [Trichonephila clavipes]|nr:hypothetical protein TNCV_2731931 [Trichonephila clavipes]
MAPGPSNDVMYGSRMNLVCLRKNNGRRREWRWLGVRYKPTHFAKRQASPPPGIMEETTTRWSRSYPPRCTTVCYDRRIVRMEVMDLVATSRVIATQIQSATHHSVSTRTIRYRLPVDVCKSSIASVILDWKP